MPIGGGNPIGGPVADEATSGLADGGTTAGLYLDVEKGNGSPESAVGTFDVDDCDEFCIGNATRLLRFNRLLGGAWPDIIGGGSFHPGSYVAMNF